jgi:DNA-binding beta-propeller fold protein YncE
VVVPEPKAPHPMPPKAIFREIIGSFGLMTGSFDHPTDVARDLDGNFYVLDTGNNRVEKFDRFANFVVAWGARGYRKGNSGKLDAEFKNPAAIAVGPADAASSADQLLYVVDAGNDRIQRFDLKGGFQEAWGSRGSSDGDFKDPTDIAVFKEQDGKVYVYVVDSGNDRVLKFPATGAGTALAKYERSAPGVTGGTFTGLKSIALSHQRFGYFYLLGAGCVVQKFSFEGTLVTTWSAVPPESGLCVPARLEIDDKNDYVYVLDAGNSQLSCYDPDGLYRWTLREGQVPFSKPLGFAMDNDAAEFLVADTDNNIVQKFTLR